MVTRCFPVAKIVGSSPIGVVYVVFLSWGFCIVYPDNEPELNFSGILRAASPTGYN